jgi:hypothetical protein
MKSRAWPHRLTSRAILGYNIPVVPTGLTISFYDRFVIFGFYRTPEITPLVSGAFLSPVAPDFVLRPAKKARRKRPVRCRFVRAKFQPMRA